MNSLSGSATNKLWHTAYQKIVFHLLQPEASLFVFCRGKSYNCRPLIHNKKENHTEHCIRISHVGKALAEFAMTSEM